MKKVISVLLVCLLLVSLAACGDNKKEDVTETATYGDQIAPSATQEDFDPEDFVAVEDEDETVTDAPDTTEPTVSPTTEATTTAATVAAEEISTRPCSSWEDAPADKLYRPDESYFIDQYTAYVFCIDISVQDYVKMRLGPSKSHFNIAANHIPNRTAVTVETVSVDGWSLCYYNGIEGWIRSDFLFDSLNAIDQFLGYVTEESDTQEYEYAVRQLYAVDVNDEYAGEPLNMRRGPGREYDLIKQLPQGTLLEIYSDTPIIDGWVYVHEVDQKNDWKIVASGYVLYKYIKIVGGIGDKPVLYLYPEKEMNVDVSLNLADNVWFSCTYPAYKDGWRVTAQPDGTLTDRDTGKEYAYLYWELAGIADYTFDEGFVVKGSDTAQFLETVLTEIGLSVRERNEFIVYWLPLMQNNPYNLISFQREAYTSVAELTITPQPDSLLRVFMAYCPLEEPVEVPAQTFEPFVRTGFTAVEWGGARVQAATVAPTSID